ncbi:SPOR domain-containing protein [Ferrimonas balearica]|uniref:SPOR domain-containing protein n=1 Tax=Ferrimonas balearica TaxID=44012 RepID=UPI001C99A858|nr:SPOR domain-containing protein [Ferrimonas balearica]MBY5993770.1 SPOR domain-containing protein [Ferrimonas balearica]
MAKQLHNRIVGIVVLTALGVLFLPELLNGEKARVEEHFATIPLRPSAERPERPADAYQPIEAQAPSEVAALVAEADAPAEKAAESDGTVEVPVVEVSTPAQAAWAIRLGSFRDAGNVGRLVKSLQEQGYRAYTVPAKPVSGQLTVVYVGPDVSQEKLKRTQKSLADEHGLQSQLVKYDPLQM